MTLVDGVWGILEGSRWLVGAGSTWHVVASVLLLCLGMLCGSLGLKAVQGDLIGGHPLNQ